MWFGGVEENTLMRMDYESEQVPTYKCTWKLDIWWRNNKKLKVICFNKTGEQV